MTDVPPARQEKLRRLSPCPQNRALVGPRGQAGPAKQLEARRKEARRAGYRRPRRTIGARRYVTCRPPTSTNTWRTWTSRSARPNPDNARPPNASKYWACGGCTWADGADQLGSLLADKRHCGYAFRGALALLVFGPHLEVE